MSINIGAEEQCEVYIGEEQMCQGFLGTEPFFGCGAPPTVMGMVREYKGGVYQFVTEDFTTNFQDPDQDSFLKTEIVELPDIGIIKFNGTPIAEGFKFALVNVANLTYEFEEGYTVDDGGYCIEGDQCYGKSRIKIGFRTSDDSSKELLSNEATFSFLLSSGNTPPTVGDNSDTLSHTSYTFKVSSFTKDFQDAEGDSYKNVFIKALPLLGALEYSGQLVEVNQSFLVADSSNLSFKLPDRYAVYNGVLYDFKDSIDGIISKELENGSYLIRNLSGELTFADTEGKESKIKGEALTQKDIVFGFSVTDDNSVVELESEMARFTLTIQGDINIKPIYENQPPTVGDKQFNI